MSSVGEKRGLGSIGPPQPIVVYGCRFLKTKKFQITFLTQLMDVIISSSVKVLRDTYEVSTCALWKENTKKS